MVHFFPYSGTGFMLITAYIRSHVKMEYLILVTRRSINDENTYGTILQTTWTKLTFIKQSQTFSIIYTTQY